jgi:hypothetical protein
VIDLLKKLFKPHEHSNPFIQWKFIQNQVVQSGNRSWDGWIKMLF